MSERAVPSPEPIQSSTSVKKTKTHPKASHSTFSLRDPCQQSIGGCSRTATTSTSASSYIYDDFAGLSVIASKATPSWTSTGLSNLRSTASALSLVRNVSTITANIPEQSSSAFLVVLGGLVTAINNAVESKSISATSSAESTPMITGGALDVLNSALLPTTTSSLTLESAVAYAVPDFSLVTDLAFSTSSSMTTKVGSVFAQSAEIASSTTTASTDKPASSDTTSSSVFISLSDNHSTRSIGNTLSSSKTTISTTTQHIALTTFPYPNATTSSTASIASTSSANTSLPTHKTATMQPQQPQQPQQKEPQQLQSQEQEAQQQQQYQRSVAIAVGVTIPSAALLCIIGVFYYYRLHRNTPNSRQPRSLMHLHSNKHSRVEQGKSLHSSHSTTPDSLRSTSPYPYPGSNPIRTPTWPLTAHSTNPHHRRSHKRQTSSTTGLVDTSQASGADLADLDFWCGGAPPKPLCEVPLYLEAPLPPTPNASSAHIQTPGQTPRQENGHVRWWDRALPPTPTPSAPTLTTPTPTPMATATPPSATTGTTATTPTLRSKNWTTPRSFHRRHQRHSQSQSQNERYSHSRNDRQISNSDRHNVPHSARNSSSSGTKRASSTVLGVLHATHELRLLAHDAERDSVVSRYSESAASPIIQEERAMVRAAESAADSEKENERRGSKGHEVRLGRMWAPVSPRIWW